MGVAKALRMLAASSAATAVVMGAVSVVPAGAAPIEKDRFQESVSEEIELCGLEVRYDAEFTGSVLGNSRGKDQLVYFSSRIRGTESWTNLETGNSYSTKFTVLDKDHKITDNGDGTLTILVLATGNEVWYGPDGKALFRNPGQVRFEVLIDHGGTPSDPSDDEFLDFLGIVKGSTGRNDLEGRDFCDDLIQFTS